MRPVLNLSAYRFVALDRLPTWRACILAEAARCHLKGTVLLAGEGINLVLAGAAEEARAFARWLREEPRFADLDVKETWSDTVPFAKLIVKIKAEIIRMNRPAIRPQRDRAPAVDAKTLARWLDTGHDDGGRRVVTLDTRNGFEVDAGRLRGALDWRLARFGDFPHALEQCARQLAGATVVAYCTGGIRCEKAALLMRDHGLDNVYQLEGGLLAYFDQVNGRHFDGDCVVFDDRVAIDCSGQPVCRELA